MADSSQTPPETPSLLGPLFTTVQIRALFGDRARIQAMPRMRAQLEARGGPIFAERVSMVLAEKLGKRAAHRLVEQVSQHAARHGGSFRAALAAHPDVRAELDDAALDRLFVPEQTLGMNDQLIARVLARAEKERA